MTRIASIIAIAVISFPIVGATAQQTSIPENQKVLWQKLEDSIHESERKLDGAMGVTIVDFKTGQTFALHADQVFPTASSIKIAVLLELYHQAQTGKLNLTDLYTVNAADLVPDSYIMGGLTPGVTRVTLRDLATMMMAVSDNSATNVLIDRVGMSNVNALMDSLGLKHTRLQRKMMDLKAASEGRENVSTPAELVAMVRATYEGKVLNQKLTEDFFQVFSIRKPDAFIQRHLPEDLRIAAKHGELEGVRNDCGMVFVPNRPYGICVMESYLHRERDGEEAISDISLAAWRMFDRLARASEYGRVISPGNSSR
jgi:beta-lactamase class A